MPGEPGTVEVTDYLTLDMVFRCRKCTACLSHRRALWRERAGREIDRAVRTWFGTLTLRPDEHFKVACVARDAASKAGIDFDGLSTAGQFVLRWSVVGPYVTRWFKRLRIEGHSLRYLLVVEEHRSENTSENYLGLPHVHLLLHEQSAVRPSLKDELQQAWPYGFSSFKLVRDRAWGANYTTKYLSKSMLARVRASIAYGKQIPLLGIDGVERSREDVTI